MMFNRKNSNTDLPKDLTKDLSKLLKQEGDFVHELSDISTKAAEFHARLESIEKAIENNPSIYNSKEANNVVQKAKEKYSNELEKRMKNGREFYLDFDVKKNENILWHILFLSEIVVAQIKDYRFFDEVDRKTKNVNFTWMSFSN